VVLGVDARHQPVPRAGIARRAAGAQERDCLGQVVPERGVRDALGVEVALQPADLVGPRRSGRFATSAAGHGDVIGTESCDS
jgi:hypothetical protein